MGELSDIYSVIHHLEKPNRKPPSIKTFRQQWLENPIFTDWLSEIEGFPDKCYCKVCHTTLSAGHSELERHAAGRKHCVLMKEEKLKNSNVEKESTNTVLNQTDRLEDKIVTSLQALQDENDARLKSTTKNLQKSNVSVNKTQKDLPTRLRQELLPGGFRSIKKQRLTENIPKKSGFPEVVDVSKLLKLPDSEDEDSYDSDDSRFDGSVDLNASQLLRGLQAEADHSEKMMCKERMNTQMPIPSNSKMHEKELDARLCMIREKRRYNFNIYKLKLLEMESRLKMAEEERRTRTRLAEEERVRADELHQLRTAQLQLQIQRENDFVTDEAFTLEPVSKDASMIQLSNLPVPTMPGPIV